MLSQCLGLFRQLTEVKASSWSRGETLVLLVSLGALRLFYGLTLDFWNDDERQIYLLGLKWYTSGEWPYFGPDVIYTQRSIPGALQAILVGLGFFLLPVPEVPIVVLNLLSLATLVVLSRYLSKFWYGMAWQTILLWLGCLTWSLEMSVHVYNPSYLLMPAVAFWISYLELQPITRQGVVSPKLCFFLMGAALAYIGQIHLSWPLLVPFLLHAMWIQRHNLAQRVALLLAGASMFLLLLIPTLDKYGIFTSLQAGTSNTKLNWSHLSYVMNHLVRLISYGTYEPWIFIGETAAERLSLLRHNFWLIPPAAILLITGALWIGWFIYEAVQAWRQGHRQERWALKLFLWLWAFSTGIYVLSSQPPHGRNFYLYFPAIVYITAMLLGRLMQRQARFYPLFKALLLTAMCFHALLAVARFSEHSIYRDRDMIVRALQEKDYTIFGRLRYEGLLP